MPSTPHATNPKSSLPHSNTWEIELVGEKIQLHAYQFSGQSNSGSIPNWRNFEIDKMINVTIDKNRKFQRTIIQPQQFKIYLNNKIYFLTNYHTLCQTDT